MATTRIPDEIIAELGAYACLAPHATYRIAFAEGDRYESGEATEGEDDNGEEFDIGEAGYEDWPEMYYRISSILNDGPNHNPNYRYLSISRRHMPSDVTSDGRLLYSAEKGLFLDHGRILDTPRTDL
jgi:hypothetical protein